MRTGRARAAGFTLIEMLVSLAIIGILAGVTMAAFGGARMRGRDAQRMTDIKNIQVALTKYYDAHDQYPSTIGSGATSVLVSEGYMDNLPTDPANGRSYAYSGYVNASNGNTTRCSSYHLGADLENSTHVGLQNDDDAYVVSVGNPANADDKVPTDIALCAGTAVDFHGGDSSKCDSLNVGVSCYDTRP